MVDIMHDKRAVNVPLFLLNISSLKQDGAPWNLVADKAYNILNLKAIDAMAIIPFLLLSSRVLL